MIKIWETLKSYALWILGLLASVLAVFGMYQKERREAEKAKRAEADARIAQQIAKEREAYQKKLDEVNNEPVDIDQFTRDPRN